jgi:hypothetical protein
MNSYNTQIYDIYAKDLNAERALLESLGVIVKERREDEGVYFRCLVDDAAMQKLDPHWGRFMWYSSDET